MRESRRAFDRRKRAALTTHVQDPGNPRMALCGKEPEDLSTAFRYKRRQITCALCEAFKDDPERLAAVKALLIPKKCSQARKRDYAEADRRRLMVRPSGLERGIVDEQEARRFPSRERCGGGWRK